jgi:hypothetical protein
MPGDRRNDAVSFFDHVPIDRDWLLFPEKSNNESFWSHVPIDRDCFFFAEKKKKESLGLGYFFRKK